MIDNPSAVYRGSGPAVIAWWRALCASILERSTTLDKITADFDGRRLYQTRAGLRHQIVGVEARDGEHRNPPDGWRYDRRYGCLVPKVSTKAGKAHARRLADGTSGHPKAPGMPDEQFVGLRLLAPGYFENDGVVYATWAATFEAVEQGGGRVGTELDLNIWHRCPLSEYHAMREAEAAVAS